MTMGCGPSIMDRVMLKQTTCLASLAALLALAACKPPPTDAAIERAAPQTKPTFASAPLPSPETESAIWAPSQKPGRLIYGVPEQPALIALECLTKDEAPLLQITRMAQADEGAEALLALVGNGALGRIEVDATEVGPNLYWQGAIDFTDRNLEPLLGPRKVTATIPGAGMVELNPSPLLGAFLQACITGGSFAPIAAQNAAKTDDENAIGTADRGAQDAPSPTS